MESIPHSHDLHKYEEEKTMANFDIYKMITDRIIAELKNGIIPWHKPWFSKDGAVSHVNGKSYSMLNQMLLGCSGEWLTFAQVEKEGGKVKKGEKGSIVVFWKFLDKKTGEVDDKGNEIIEHIPFLRYITVFEVGQCENIKRKYEAKTTDTVPDAEAQKIFYAYVTREGIKVNEGEQAFYRPSADSITLPNINRFAKVAEYYSTAFHEAIHSTGAEKRLNREGVTGLSFFGSHEYSKEELIAELGTSMILNRIGMETPSSFKNNTAYIQSWLKRLEGDTKFIVSSASKAEKAVKFLFGDTTEEEVA